MDAQKVGAFIAQCGKEKGMTQSDLAAKIMVTDKAVSRWERGVPKGATPPFGTRLCEAKCNVLYLLAWLAGKTGCGASCAPFAPAGKQAEFLRMGMNKKSGCFQRTAAGI